MIGVTNNSPQQINAALIAMKNELKREIITETKIEQTDVIDDTTTSTTKTWSSEKIANEMYPLGFIYMQLYNPNPYSPHWEKDPKELGMTPASGCKWEEITSDFAKYPYLKIGSGTTQIGHNAYHRHMVGVGNASLEATGYGLTISRGFQNRCIVAGILTYSNYDGNSTETTNEVNASNVKIWKVIEDV